MAVRAQFGAGAPRREAQPALRLEYRQIVALIARGQRADGDVQRQFAGDGPVTGDALVDDEFGKLFEYRSDAARGGDALPRSQACALRAQLRAQGAAIIHVHALNPDSGKMERLRDAGARPNDLDPDQCGVSLVFELSARGGLAHGLSPCHPGVAWQRQGSICLDTLSRIAENAPSF